MEQKSILSSALGVGMGVEVGIGLASGQSVSKWGANIASSNAITAERVEEEMLRQVIDGRDSKLNFDQFPYYLSERTRVLLTSAAYVHLKHVEVSKHTRNLAPASQAILLSGPAEAEAFLRSLGGLQDPSAPLQLESLSHGLGIFQEEKSNRRHTLKLEAQAGKPEKESRNDAIVKPEEKSENAAPEKKAEADIKASVAKAEGENSVPASKTAEVPPDNEFEKRIRPEVIPVNEISVTFSDIGALDEIKESLQELVMLPLRRPDLFTGGLLKPCRGILLFGPHGTGKTMLATALAKEAGASFINVSLSTITSKWFGEDEKNVRALFTLAAKVSPTIIFVDEVDSMLGQRTTVGEHEAMRKIKNEFMAHWDGLMTKPGERILVLGATNRPFDLDEAIIRRFERRIMVGMPSVENREKILRTLLAKETMDEELDFKELATMTEGYSGSDLKNLCTTAAYQPVRELIQKERLKNLEKKQKAAEGEEKGEVQNKQGEQFTAENTQDALNAEEEGKAERVINLRPLNMQDFREARDQVAASFAAEGAGMSELKQWNDLYGEGGSRKKQQLSYFL